jgi:hypothetical protein
MTVTSLTPVLFLLSLSKGLKTDEKNEAYK